MANKEHLEILKQGVEVWNKWREDNPHTRPNLIGADLAGEDLIGANLTEADFTRADLKGADLIRADLTGAYLNGTDISGADLNGADLTGASLAGADLNGADLSSANLNDADLAGTKLTNANLNGADLSDANLHDADLFGANLTDVGLDGAFFFEAKLWSTKLSSTNFENAWIGNTSFSNVDLSVAKGLDKIQHDGPSSIGIDTLYQSGGNIPEEFLRDCGVPEDFITFIPSLIGAQEAIQFYSCFISYSTKDEEFARRLYSRMRDKKLRVWFAPEEMKGGEKVHEQIESAIQLHDRLLVVLSEESMKSNWVINEIRNARRVELRENRRKLFPIGLAAFDRIKEWKRIDPDTGEDLALELRSYYIPDFSNWKDHDSFEKEFEKLLRDLRAEEKRQAGDSS